MHPESGQASAPVRRRLLVAGLMVVVACSDGGSTVGLDGALADGGALDSGHAAEAGLDEAGSGGSGFDGAGPDAAETSDSSLDAGVLSDAAMDAGEEPELAPVVPPLPTPRVLGEVPTSEVITRITPWDTLQPQLRRARCEWTVSVRRCSYFENGDQGCGDFVATPESSGTFFSDELPDDDLDLVVALPNLDLRMLLVEGGERVAPAGTFERRVNRTEQPGLVLEAFGRYAYACPALEATPYMRFDRRWEPLRVDGEGLLLLLHGDTEYTLSLTYAVGVSVEEATTFAETTTTSVGAEFEGLSAALEESIAETYEVSVQVSAEASTTINQTVRGKDGVTRQFMIWQLVDTFMVTDDSGEPLADANYGYDPVVLEVRGARALKVTEF